MAQAANINLAGVLHGEQDLIFHNPIPKAGTLTTEGAITHIYDKGDKGALILAEFDTFHSGGGSGSSGSSVSSVSSGSGAGLDEIFARMGESFDPDAASGLRML